MFNLPSVMTIAAATRSCRDMSAETSPPLHFAQDLNNSKFHRHKLTIIPEITCAVRHRFEIMPSSKFKASNGTVSGGSTPRRAGCFILSFWTGRIRLWPQVCKRAWAGLGSASVALIIKLSQALEQSTTTPCISSRSPSLPVDIYRPHMMCHS